MATPTLQAAENAVTYPPPRHFPPGLKDLPYIKPLLWSSVTQTTQTTHQTQDSKCSTKGQDGPPPPKAKNKTLFISRVWNQYQQYLRSLGHESKEQQQEHAKGYVAWDSAEILSTE